MLDKTENIKCERPSLDHAMIAAAMAGMDAARRAEFWPDHRRVLAEALADRGLRPEAIEGALAEHFATVRQIGQAEAKREKARGKYAINLDALPDVGTKLMVHGKQATLVRVEPHTRRDGTASYVLHWDVDGRRATSGLRSQGLLFERPSEGGAA